MFARRYALKCYIGFMVYQTILKEDIYICMSCQKYIYMTQVTYSIYIFSYGVVNFIMIRVDTKKSKVLIKYFENLSVLWKNIYSNDR